MVEAAYFDSSLLVKAYDISETGSREAQAFFRRYRGCSSMLIYPEVISVLARKQRRGELSSKNMQALLRAFKKDYSQILVVRLTEEVIQESERLLFGHSLTAIDSIHLASALILRRELGRVLPFATADHDLALASQREGIETFRF